MISRLKVRFHLNVVIVILLGISLTIWTMGKAGSQSSKQGEATEFFYLPLVKNFPPVWFIKSPESPIYLQNYANNAGCNWAGIAGEVFDLQGNPVSFGEYRVHAWGSGIDNRVPVGGVPVYGPSGYEIFLFDSPIMNDYNLQLETADGSFASPIFVVQTHASCAENLLYFVFVQDH